MSDCNDAFSSPSDNQCMAAFVGTLEIQRKDSASFSVVTGQQCSGALLIVTTDSPTCMYILSYHVLELLESGYVVVLEHKADNGVEIRIFVFSISYVL